MGLRRWDSLGYLLNHLARLFARSLERRIRGRGVSLGQFPVLLALWEEDGLTQAELCRRVRIEQPTMANTLNRMARDGLIDRKPYPRDRRRVAINLTEKAKRLELPLTDEARAVNALAAGVLTAAEQVEFDRLLRKVCAALERDAVGAREA